MVRLLRRAEEDDEDEKAVTGAADVELREREALWVLARVTEKEGRGADEDDETAGAVPLLCNPLDGAPSTSSTSTAPSTGDSTLVPFRLNLGLLALSCVKNCLALAAEVLPPPPGLVGPSTGPSEVGERGGGGE
jgi:hypothetical protein